MTQVVEPKPLDAPAATDVPSEGDLTAAIHRALASSPEPLTPSKIRSALPVRFRTGSLDELSECLRRQAAANVLYEYPKYRSPHERYWDRSMPVHVASLLRATLEEAGPLPWSELRRKLPAYTLAQAEAVLAEQVKQGLLYRHPPAGKRGGDRFGAQPPDSREYLRTELSAVFHRLEGLGFTLSQLRAGALELLHDEEWAPTPPAPVMPAAKERSAPEPAAPTAEGNPAAAPAPEATTAGPPPAAEQPS